MLKLQYFGNPMRRANSLEETLMLGKIEGRRSRWQRTRWLDGITDLMDMNLSKPQEVVKDSSQWGYKELVTTEWLKNNNESKDLGEDPSQRSSQGSMEASSQSKPGYGSLVPPLPPLRNLPTLSPTSLTHLPLPPHPHSGQWGWRPPTLAHLQSAYRTIP